MDLSSFHSDLVKNYLRIIIKHIITKIGKEQILSIIVTGSVARNQESYSKKNGQKFLESDIDVIIIVKQFSVLKSLHKGKIISEFLTRELNKKGHRSHVSSAITTERSFLQMKPSIFYHDLKRNGKIIYGKKIIEKLPTYAIKQIPNVDVNKLLLNRMVETLETLISQINSEKNSGKITFYFLLKSFQKLIFTMIQSLLIKHDILLFHYKELIELQQDHEVHKLKIPKELLSSLRNVTSLIENQNEIAKGDLELLWLKTIENFDFTLKTLWQVPKISQKIINEQFSKNEHFFQRFKISILIFLKYLKKQEVIEVFKTISYVLVYGQFRVYSELYSLFKSSTDFLKIKYLNGNIQRPTLTYSEEKGRSLRSLVEFIRIWKFIYI